MPIDSVALVTLAERWSGARAAERANFQPYLIELCEALGVERPGPAGSGYEFELPVKVITRDGVEVSNFIDCYRANYFAIEAKDEEPGRSTELLLRRAFGQLRHYASHAPGGLPPYLIVMDVARSAIVWDRWNGNYGDWQAGRRVDLARLADHEDDARFLHAIWTDPESLNPRSRAQAVTTEVAGHLANLARSLEGEGYAQERVAQFVMRCVFTMFAEDVGLLANEPFRQILERCTDDPASFEEQAVALWQAMDEGKKFDWKKLMRFNGHFFRSAEALPLTKHAVAVLRLAALADWQDVEPAIFGTLLTRALDPEERHRLGAEFTPREFVERVVMPTVEEPIRERWKAVQAAVLQLTEGGKRKEAEKRLREFHDWLRGLRFLDPACGSGNFLYVTMHLVKRVELEVLRELDAVTGKHELLLEEVHPRQFFGIEVKLWAREIAELVLWIGYHQFWRAHHTQRPQEPVLQDTGTIECRDAVLMWDAIRHDPTRDRPDPTPRVAHPITGKPVPDPNAELKYLEYVNPRQAAWPRADFIIGNPPYLGQGRQREEFGDGYVDALRAAYPQLADSADYVMYWWSRAADLVAEGQALRAGLITTNTITQAQNRKAIASAAAKGARVVWAVADHPWVDESDGAAVRVALTVVAQSNERAVLADVDDDGAIVAEHTARNLNADLSVTADVPSAAKTRLVSNEGLAATGFKLHGAGFLLKPEEAERLLGASPNLRFVVRRYRNARDLTNRPRRLFVIDFAAKTESEARQFPVAFDIVRTRVKPERDANNEPSRRTYWWRFGRTNEMLRSALLGLGRYIATPETAKHRFFEALDGDIAPDNMLACICVDDAFVLGVLSGTVHVTWALAAGGRLGIGNDPRYNKTLCFDPFPFPDPDAPLREAIGEVAEKLDAHRKDAADRDKTVTMTGMYNVVEKLRTGEALTDKERRVHEVAACGILKDLHDELDVLVARAYGWPWPLDRDAILERLVALHDERVLEEKSGRVRWLRPEYQTPRFGKELPSPDLGLVDAVPVETEKQKRAFPADVISQIGAIKQLLSQEVLAAKEIVARFSGAKPDLIRRHLDILLVMGEVQQNPDGRYQGAA